MKILTILGARTQFIKAGSVSRDILKSHEAGVDINEVIGHTYLSLQNKILAACKSHSTLSMGISQLDLYGNGKASQRIISELLND